MARTFAASRLSSITRTRNCRSRSAAAMVDSPSIPIRCAEPDRNLTALYGVSGSSPTGFVGKNWKWSIFVGADFGSSHKGSAIAARHAAPRPGPESNGLRRAMASEFVLELDHQDRVLLARAATSFQTMLL